MSHNPSIKPCDHPTSRYVAVQITHCTHLLLICNLSVPVLTNKLLPLTGYPRNVQFFGPPVFFLTCASFSPYHVHLHTGTSISNPRSLPRVAFAATSDAFSNSPTVLSLTMDCLGSLLLFVNSSRPPISGGRSPDRTFILVLGDASARQL